MFERQGFQPVKIAGDMKYALPFGTFLAMGAAAAATVGPGLLTWYTALW